jgi:hypothetical protein
MKPRANIALLLLSLLLPCAAASAQELQASVRVLTDALPPEHRYDVATLEQDLQLYLTTQRFGDAPWEHLPIPTELTVILTGRSGSLYSARLVLQMAVPLPNGPSPVLQLTDDQWSFSYSRGAFLSYQPLRYDPLLSLIDFYVLLGIGLVADSYTEHGGTGYYRTACQIGQLAAAQRVPGFERFVNPGEFSRMLLCTELLDPSFLPLRSFLWRYHNDVLDRLPLDRSEALQTLDSLLSELSAFKARLAQPSVALQFLFNAKYRELIELLSGVATPELILRLRSLDPKHGTEYERLLGR